MSGERRGVVVVLEGQSLKRDILQIRRRQKLRELGNDDRVVVRILAAIRQVSERPRRRGAVQKPLSRYRQRILHVLH